MASWATRLVSAFACTDASADQAWPCHLRPGLDPDDLAVTLLAAVQGGLLLAQVQRNTRPLETAVDTVLALATSKASRTSGSRTRTSSSPDLLAT